MDNKTVSYRLPGGDLIDIRKAYLGREGFPSDDPDAWQNQSLYEVSFDIRFTFGGPVAYNVRPHQRNMVDKIKKF